MEVKPFRTTRRMANLRQGRNDWFRIENKVSGPSMVHIYDEIGYVGVSANDFVQELSNVKGDLEVHLNSPGGDVFDGLAIYNALVQRPGTVSIIVDGLAASAASFIAQAASPGQLKMAKNANLMIHDGMAISIGNAADMRETAELLDKASDNIASIYSERTGKPLTYFRNLMKKETWFSAQEAVDEGLADEILPTRSGVDNSWDLSVFRNAKKKKPKRYDPDHDGDNDATPAGDTDHDYWTSGGKQKKSVPGKPMKKKQKAAAALRILNEKYDTDDRKRMAKSGQAMPDGSYPIADEEDLHNAIHAVGRGNADHDDIRRHIIKRAKALGLSSEIPDDWNSDGSLKTSNKGSFRPSSNWAEGIAIALKGVK